MDRSNVIAKPYARAVFEIALAQQALERWLNILQLAVVVLQHDEVKHLIMNPCVDNERLATFFFTILNEDLDEQSKKFLRLLIIYRRLTYLPQITTIFMRLLADYQQSCMVEVCSAMPLSEEQQQQLIQMLQQRVQRQIKLNCQVEASLLGGAVIKIEDEVIDGSIRGKLNRLEEQLRETVL